MATKEQDPAVLEYPGSVVKKNYSQRGDAEFLEYVFKHLTEFEGNAEYCYLDINFNVTIGIGHLIPDESASVALPFKYKNPPDPPHDVSADEKKAEWKRVKNLEGRIKKDFLNKGEGFPYHKAEIFSQATLLKLEQTDIKVLFDQDIASRLMEIKNIFPRFNQYPDPAKLGIVDLYYNVKHFYKFVEFKKFVIQEDWHNAGIESDRKGPNEDRLQRARDLFDEAATIKKKLDGGSDEVKDEDQKIILGAETDYDDTWQS